MILSMAKFNFVSTSNRHRIAVLIILVICLDPAPKNGIPHKPWRMRDDPRAVAAKQAADPQSDAMVVSRDYMSKIDSGSNKC